MDMEKTIAYIRNNREDLAAIKDKILEFAVESNPMTLRNFFVRCAKLKLPATALAYYTMLWLAERGRTDIIDALFSSTTPDNAFYGVYCIGKAFSDFRNYDLKTGGEHLREGLYQSLRVNYKNIPDQDLLLRNAFLLEDIEWPGGESFPKPPFEVLCDNRFADAPYTCCIACAPECFERFFGQFMQELRRGCGNANVFLLLINPNEEMAASASEYDGIILAQTRYDGRWQAEFCDLSLLMLAAEIMNEVSGPVIFMNPDINFPQKAGQALSEISAPNLGLFAAGGILPTDMISTRLIASRPCAGTMAFWEEVGKVVLRGFARTGPLGGLGEMALLASASNEVERHIFDSGFLETFYGENLLSSATGKNEVTNDCFKAASVTHEKRIDVAEKHKSESVEESDSKYRKVIIPFDLSGAMEKTIKFVRGNLGHGERIIEAVLNFADGANPEMINNLFMETRSINGLQPFDFAYFALRQMVEKGKGDKVSALFERVNENNPFWGLYSIGQSFKDCMDWEIEDCAHNMREGLYHCLTNKVNFSDLGFVIQNAYLLETVTWPESGRPTLPDPLFKVLHNNLFEESPYAVGMGYSLEYVRRYLKERIKNIRETCGSNINIIVHLLNPDDTVVDELRGIEGLLVVEICHDFGNVVRPDLLSITGLPRSIELLKVLKQPLISVELDSHYPSGIAEIFKYIFSRDTPVYCDIKSTYPIIRVDGALGLYNPRNPKHIEYTKIAQEYKSEIFTKGGPIYLYDQLSWYRAVCVCKKRGWDMTDVNEFMQGRFRYFFKGGPEGEHPVPLEERWKTRTNSRYRFGGMTQEKRQIWIPIGQEAQTQ